MFPIRLKGHTDLRLPSHGHAENQEFCACQVGSQRRFLAVVEMSLTSLIIVDMEKKRRIQQELELGQEHYQQIMQKVEVFKQEEAAIRRRESQIKDRRVKLVTIASYTCSSKIYTRANTHTV
jgi:hypothetical protein